MSINVLVVLFSHVYGKRMNNFSKDYNIKLISQILRNTMYTLNYFE